MVQYFFHQQHGIEADVGIGGIDLAGSQELEILPGASGMEMIVMNAMNAGC